MPLNFSHTLQKHNPRSTLMCRQSLHLTTGTASESSYCFSRSQTFRWLQAPSGQCFPHRVSRHRAISQKFPSKVRRSAIIIPLSATDTIETTNLHRKRHTAFLVNRKCKLNRQCSCLVCESVGISFSNNLSEIYQTFAHSPFCGFGYLGHSFVPLKCAKLIGIPSKSVLFLKSAVNSAL